MYIVFNCKKEDNKYKFTSQEGKTIGDVDLFRKNNIFEVNENTLFDFITLFCLPLSRGKLDAFDAKDNGKIKLFSKSLLTTKETEYLLQEDVFNVYKKFILNFNKETLCNNITSLGYKYFDASSSIYGNREFSTELQIQDYDLTNKELHNLYFIVRQFYFKGNKTSIYEEIKKYKKGLTYFLEIKEIFEKLYFSYDDLNIQKKEYSSPRANIFVKIEDSYKTISPVPTISQILSFNELFSSVNYNKIGEIGIGGSQPQNIGFFSSLFGGKFKCYENILSFQQKNKNLVYQIKFNLIPKNSFENFNERKTYKKINYLNVLLSNKKTNNKLLSEINFILDDLIELIFLTIDYIKYEPEDSLGLANEENFKLIKNIIDKKDNSIKDFIEKLKEEVFKKLKYSKNIKYYDKRTKFFDNIIQLTLEKVLNYV